MSKTCSKHKNYFKKKHSTFLLNYGIMLKQKYIFNQTEEIRTKFYRFSA